MVAARAQSEVVFGDASFVERRGSSHRMDNAQLAANMEAKGCSLCLNNPGILNKTGSVRARACGMSNQYRYYPATGATQS